MLKIIVTSAITLVGCCADTGESLEDSPQLQQQEQQTEQVEQEEQTEGLTIEDVQE